MTRATVTPPRVSPPPCRVYGEGGGAARRATNANRRGPDAREGGGDAGREAAAWPRKGRSVSSIEAEPDQASHATCR